METALATIPARSRRQAMDWSLVLASQGIEAVIEHAPESGGWMLLVEPAQCEPALAAIRQYRVENRGWLWRSRLPAGERTFHWGVLLWCWMLIVIHWLGGAEDGSLAGIGAMNDRVAATGEWWRLFTAVTLHADVAHLAANVSTGLVVLGMAMARFGPGRALLAGLLAGALGNLAGLLLHTGHYIGLGASGMVMGGLGLLTAQSLALLRHGPLAWRPVLTGLAGGLLLFVLVGMNPASDVVAHAGGFAGGLLGGTVLSLLPTRWARSRKFDQMAGLLALALVAVAWTLAALRSQVT
jgi:membrane associated rhomboid family serine protease